jgi:NAD-dependent dihydropyrimidine dehydrogenase PreA subunit
MAVRKIVKIEDTKCNGCGECIPNCREGALQIIDGKARLLSDYFCDGLGACLGHCPMDAITVEEREAQEYSERKVMEKIITQGENTLIAHLSHLKDHNEIKLLNEAISFLNEKNMKVPNYEKEKKVHQGCPGSREVNIQRNENESNIGAVSNQSELTQWPIQMHLVSPRAPFFNNSHLLIAASCSAFTMGGFHRELLHNKKLIIACPKLDRTEPYLEKLVEIFKNNTIKSVTVAIMEVPCCGGLQHLVQEAVTQSGKNIPLIVETISLQGEIL